jgi:hypothetical protein
MVKSQGVFESLKSTNGGERDENLLLFCRTETFREEERAVWEDREKYKYPCLPTVT